MLTGFWSENLDIHHSLKALKALKAKVLNIQKASAYKKCFLTITFSALRGGSSGGRAIA